MPQRFLRTVRVTVGDAAEALRIENLLVRFRLRREATDTPADGHITIYNLTVESEQRIRQRGQRIRLEAGYSGELSLLFDGDVRRVERVREQVDRAVKIHVGGNVAKRRQAVFTRTYEVATPLRTIFADAAATFDLAVGPLSLIDEDIVKPAGFSYQGPTALLLYGLLEPYGLRWFEDDGVIRLTRRGQSGDDRPRGVLIGQRSGMIGTPTITDDGLRVRSLIDPRLRLDTRFRVESELVDAGALWKIVEVTHQGDNWTGSFETLVEGRPLD